MTRKMRDIQSASGGDGNKQDNKMRVVFKAVSFLFFDPICKRIHNLSYYCT